MKYYLFIIGILFSLNAIAQQKSNNITAYAGEKGIYIYNVFKPASARYPDGAATGFKLERQQNGKTDWEFVSNYETPSSFEAFEKKVAYAQKVAFSKSGEVQASTVWRKFEKCHCLDSIAQFLIYQDYDIAFNLILADTTLQKGYSYTYRISQIDKDDKIITGYTTNEVQYPGSVSYKMPRFCRRDAMKTQIRVIWGSKADIVLPKTFRIYRRRETESKFEIINASAAMSKAKDSLYYSIVDKNVTENEMYYYFIAPTNAFGGGFNVKSDTVAVTNYELRDMMLPQLFKAYGDDKKNLVHLSWRVYKPAFVGSIQIFRSESYDKDFKQIGSAANFDTMYEDRSIHSGIKYFYYLKITDKLQHQSERSVKIFGIYYSKRTPRLPENVRSVTTEIGTTIKWKSADEDIDGYYVSRCRGIDGKMEIISHFIKKTDTSGQFSDTMKLDPAYQYGYAVQQENITHVLSPYTKTIYIQPRTKIILFAPKSLQAIRGDNNVTLLWEDMRLQNPSLAGYNIYRREQGMKEFTKLNTIPVPSQNHTYTDLKIESGKIYEYSVELVDINNNTSSKSASAQVNIPGLPLSAPADLQAFASDNGVTLQWSASLESNAITYNLYRYQRGVKPSKIASITGMTYSDNTAKKDELYFYYVIAVNGNGDESMPSREISLRGK